MQVKGRSASGVMAALLGLAPAMAWGALLAKGRVGPISIRVSNVSFFAGSSFPKVRRASLPLGRTAFQCFQEIRGGCAVRR